jgi:hypothetical protein
MRLSLLGLALLCASALPSCILAIGPDATDGAHSHWGWSGIRGSGVSATQARSVPEFHGIRIEGSCDVVATVGGEASLSVTADDNLIEYLTTEVHEGVLVISTREGISASYSVGPMAKIQLKSLDSVSIEGSGNVEAGGIDCESFVAAIGGSGEMSLRGKARRVAVSVAGSGDADLGGLEAQEAHVQIDGSGDVRVNCSQSLSAAVSGSGDVEYLGSPATTVSVSGSGSVHPVR